MPRTKTNPISHDIETPMPFLQTSVTAKALWLGGERNLILAAGERTGERLAVVAHEARRGWSPPWHRQPHDDESFYVLEGELRIWAGDPNEPLGRAGPGTLVFLPRGGAHSFRVESETRAGCRSAPLPVMSAFIALAGSRRGGRPCQQPRLTWGAWMRPPPATASNCLVRRQGWIPRGEDARLATHDRCCLARVFWGS